MRGVETTRHQHFDPLHRIYQLVTTLGVCLFSVEVGPKFCCGDGQHLVALSATT